MRRNEDEKASDHRRSPPFGNRPDTRRKNSVLPVLAACCLCTSPCVLHNCPDIEDVRTALAILESLGCKTRREGSTLCIDASGLSKFCVEKRLAGKMRSSILFLGALLARCGKAELALPAGARWESGRSICM